MPERDESLHPQAEANQGELHGAQPNRGEPFVTIMSTYDYASNTEHSGVAASTQGSRGQEGSLLRMLAGGSMPLLLRASVSLLLFMLLREWLLAMKAFPIWSNGDTLTPIILGAGLFMLTGLFLPPLWVTLLLNGLVVIVIAAANLQAGDTSILGKLLLLPVQINDDLSLLMQGEYAELTGPLKITCCWLGSPCL